VTTGTLLVEAARSAGTEIQQPCGGQGRCGRCIVTVADGSVRRRSALRLSAEDIAAGMALACQTVVEGDVSVVVPPPEAIERRLTTDHVAPDVVVPTGYDPVVSQTIRRTVVDLAEPSMDDQTDDWSRLATALRKQAGVDEVVATLGQLRRVGPSLRNSGWRPAVTYDTGSDGTARLIRIDPPDTIAEPLWGLAIDVGTTTVTVWLVDLGTGEVGAQLGEYNRQISRGEDHLRLEEGRRR
jgi:uncharacterized 2Fe-2S/4Fe-4S cluster protein (DUF4445 family)